MIIFTTLFLTVTILAIVSIIGVAITGAAGIVIFGDVIVCAWLIIKLIKKLSNKNKRH